MIRADLHNHTLPLTGATLLPICTRQPKAANWIGTPLSEHSPCHPAMLARCIQVILSDLPAYVEAVS